MKPSSYLVIDVETTIENSGNSFTRRNKMCMVGTKSGLTGESKTFQIEYDAITPYGEDLETLQNEIFDHDMLVGFNIKFDLHWLRRYGIVFDDHRVFDCQLAEFMLGNQREPYPALGTTCERRGLGSKLDVVKEQYWERGLDTTQVPYDVLEEYCLRDIDLTEKLFRDQVGELRNAGLMSLNKLQNQDLLILEEMEWNGLRYNMEAAKSRGKDIDAEISRIDGSLASIVPVDGVNYRSNTHLSAIIYGGRIHRPVRERVVKVLRSGGTSERERWGTKVEEFLGFTKPLKGTENIRTKRLSDEDLKRRNEEKAEAGKEKPLERQWSVASPILRRLKINSEKGRKFVETLLLRSELEKQNNTYYTGLCEKLEPMDWPKDELHSSLNQCVAVTGRLSSSSPNAQNFSGSCKDLFYSRFSK